MQDKEKIQLQQCISTKFTSWNKYTMNTKKEKKAAHPGIKTMRLDLVKTVDRYKKFSQYKIPKKIPLHHFLKNTKHLPHHFASWNSMCYSCWNGISHPAQTHEMSIIKNYMYGMSVRNLSIVLYTLTSLINPTTYITSGAKIYSHRSIKTWWNIQMFNSVIHLILCDSCRCLNHENCFALNLFLSL